MVRQDFDDTIDTQLAEFDEKHTVPNRNDDFFHQFAIMTYLRNALCDVQLTEKMMLYITENTDGLHALYRYWDSKYEDTNRNPPNSSRHYDCVSEWLNSLEVKQQNAVLTERLIAEYKVFIEKEKLKTPVEIIEDAYRITCYNDITTAFQWHGENLNLFAIDTLLSLEQPLDEIFTEFLKMDTTFELGNFIDSARELTATFQSKSTESAVNDEHDYHDAGQEP